VSHRVAGDFHRLARDTQSTDFVTK